MLDVFFYETFEEEKQAIKRYLPRNIKGAVVLKRLHPHQLANVLM